VVLGVRGLDVEAGVEECSRLSLIDKGELEDGQPSYSAPQLARVFGRKKLDSDPDRLVIQEDIETIRRFGVLPLTGGKDSQELAVTRFISSCRDEATGASPERVRRLNALLETLAQLWPSAWLDLARFRKDHNFEPGSIEAALRRAVEDNPDNKKAWLERAAYAQQTGNSLNYIACLVSSVDADPDDVGNVREVAYQLASFIKQRILEIPQARRGVYLARVRTHMEKVAGRLDATGLSRLAWLFLLEGDDRKASQYAKQGLEKEPYNEHCLRILERVG